MTTEKIKNDGFSATDVFTYDEIVALIKRRQKFYISEHRRASPDRKVHLFGMHMGCSDLIKHLAALAAAKQKRRLIEKGLLTEQTHYSDDSLRPGPQGSV